MNIYICVLQYEGIEFSTFCFFNEIGIPEVFQFQFEFSDTSVQHDFPIAPYYTVKYTETIN